MSPTSSRLGHLSTMCFTSCIASSGVQPFFSVKWGQALTLTRSHLIWLANYVKINMKMFYNSYKYRNRRLKWLSETSNTEFCAFINEINILTLLSTCINLYHDFQFCALSFLFSPCCIQSSCKFIWINCLHHVQARNWQNFAHFVSLQTTNEMPLDFRTSVYNLKIIKCSQVTVLMQLQQN